MVGLPNITTRCSWCTFTQSAYSSLCTFNTTFSLSNIFMDATFEFAFTTICTFTFHATFVFSKACIFVFNLDFPFSKASICASNKPFILVKFTTYSSWIFTISLYLSPLASHYMFLLSIVFNFTIKFFINLSSFMFVSSSNLNAFEIDVFFHQLL